MNRRLAACCVVSLGLVVISGCGAGTTHEPSGQGAAASHSADEGVEHATIDGNISAGIVEQGPSVLVFVFDASPANPTPLDPVGVAVVGKDGRFSVPNLPSGRLIVAFMQDMANDGALDPGDPRAVLPDTQGMLQLHDGDHATVSDIQIDFAGSKVLAATINVTRAAGEPTPTPDQGSGVGDRVSGN